MKIERMITPLNKHEVEKKGWFEMWVEDLDRKVSKLDVMAKMYTFIFRKALGREFTKEIEKLEWK